MLGYTRWRVYNGLVTSSRFRPLSVAGVPPSWALSWGLKALRRPRTSLRTAALCSRRPPARGLAADVMPCLRREDTWLESETQGWILEGEQRQGEGWGEGGGGAEAWGGAREAQEGLGGKSKQGHTPRHGPMGPD